ncbi:hypothetical protein [Mucilaginibacter gracilis]|uniref:hypothetical protein n=1 Tax=Mucilaginibacter gracilis TaxID=423350 RepID=UPI0011C49837|nr:hypothetical protein [Mucilaginibacter gracilis]
MSNADLLVIPDYAMHIFGKRCHADTTMQFLMINAYDVGCLEIMMNETTPFRRKQEGSISLVYPRIPICTPLLLVLS